MTDKLAAVLIDHGDLLAHRPPPTEDVAVPEIGPGKVVRLQGLTAAQRDAWEAETITVDGHGRTRVDRRNTQARLLVKCIVDAQGKRQYTDEDANVLGHQPAYLLDRLARVAMRLSGMLSAKELEDAKGN